MFKDNTLKGYTRFWFSAQPMKATDVRKFWKLSQPGAIVGEGRSRRRRPARAIRGHFFSGICGKFPSPKGFNLTLRTGFQHDGKHFEPIQSGAQQRAALSRAKVVPHPPEPQA
jgi:hypothetical protein